MTVLCPGPVETGFAVAMGLDEEVANGALPRFMWVPAESVAAEAVEAMDRGRGVVIPGLPNRVGARLAYLTPRRLLLPILSSQHPSRRA